MDPQHTIHFLRRQFPAIRQQICPLSRCLYINRDVIHRSDRGLLLLIDHCKVVRAILLPLEHFYKLWCIGCKRRLSGKQLYHPPEYLTAHIWTRHLNRCCRPDDRRIAGFFQNCTRPVSINSRRIRMNRRKLIRICHRIWQRQRRQHRHICIILHLNLDLMHIDRKRCPLCKSCKQFCACFGRAHIGKIVGRLSSYSYAKHLLQPRIRDRPADQKVAARFYICLDVIHLLLADICHMREDHHACFFIPDIL